MKRNRIVIMLLLLLFTLAGCAGKTAAQPSDAAARTQENRSAEPTATDDTPEQAPEPEAAWRYALKATKCADKYEDGGVLLASIDYDYPELELVCDGEEGACGEPPAEMQTVVDAFNAGVWQYVLALDDVRDLGRTALEQYNGTDPEYRQYFTAYWGSSEVGEPYWHGDLLEVSMFTSTYWGGAHGAESSRNFHFDLKTGEFFELADLTDTPEKLHKLVSDEIVNGIYERGGEGEYFDDFAQTIESREAYNVAFGEDGVDVIFDEYEIAPYASGMPSFTVPYEKLARFLNERGKRLLDLPLEATILGDYYDALEMWYWFEGSAPLDYSDSREDTVANEFGTYEMQYLRFDEPGVRTMADLKARLLTRFSEDLVESRLNETTLAMFREFDGVLYCVSAGRGTDWTVESVDYAVELNDARNGGQITASIHRCELNEDTMERYSTGEVDQVAIPFALGETGVVFDWFPTIW